MEKFIKSNLSFASFRIMGDTTLNDFCKENSLDERFCEVESEQLKRGDIVLAKNIDKIVHIVLPLESLEKIAKKYNVSVEYIKNTNNIDKIFVGQQLLI